MENIKSKFRIRSRMMSLILAAAAVVSALVFPVSAVGQTDFDSFTVYVNGSVKDSELTLTLSLYNNPGLASAKLEMSYDNSVVRLKSQFNGSVFPDSVFYDNSSVIDRIPFIYLASDESIDPFQNFTANYDTDGVLVTYVFEILDPYADPAFKFTVPKKWWLNKDGTDHRPVVATDIPALSEHVPGDWETLSEAGPFCEGERVRRCTDCGEVIIRETIPMTKETFGLTEDSSNMIVSGFKVGVTPQMLVSHYANMGLQVTVTDKSGNVPSLIYTGCIVTWNGLEYTTAVTGDLNGDGRVNNFDIILIKRGITKRIQLNDAARVAGDLNGDGRLNNMDFIILKRYIIGKISL